MGWVVIIALVLCVAALLIWPGRLPRASRELVCACLLLGLAGYAWQGRPAMPGAPRDPAESGDSRFDPHMAKLRLSTASQFGPGAQWMTLSDGFARQGDSVMAVNVLVSAVKARPDDPDMWVGIGNALVGHAGGVMTPAAEYSYRRALALAPDSYGATYFLGLGLARAGQFDAARALWEPLAARLVKDSMLKDQMRSDMAQLDALRDAAGRDMPR